MSKQEAYDLAVIGAGPGGYVAAICAARSGLNVVLIEKEHAGGLCLNWGCIPSKILLKNVSVVSRMRHMREKNILSGTVEVNFPALIAHSRTQVEGIRKDLERLIASNNITILTGTARFTSPTSLSVSTQEGETAVSAKNFIIAAGGRPKTLAALPVDGEKIITSREALALKKLPETMTIVGGGVIGCEMATLFNALGTRVTILEYMPQLLPDVDNEISKALRKAFVHKGIDVRLSVKVTGHTMTKTGVLVEVEDAKPLESEVVLEAVGIAPQVEDLSLEASGVSLGRRGFILVDPMTYRTNVPHIYAIGDIIEFAERPHPGLAHVASAEGEIVADVVAHGEAPWTIDYENIPMVIFTDPEIGTCGLTKEEAQKRFPDHKIAVQSTPERSMGIAMALEEVYGIDKIVVDYDRHGETLGAHLIGPAATERIHVWTTARRAEESALTMVHQVMAHPTFSETFRESLLALDGKAVHIPLMKQIGRKKK